MTANLWLPFGEPFFIENFFFSCSFQNYCLPLHLNIAKTAVGIYTSVFVGCPSGGSGATLWIIITSVCFVRIALRIYHIQEDQSEE